MFENKNLKIIFKKSSMVKSLVITAWFLFDEKNLGNYYIDIY